MPRADVTLLRKIAARRTVCGFDLARAQPLVTRWSRTLMRWMLPAGLMTRWTVARK